MKTYHPVAIILLLLLSGILLSSLVPGGPIENRDFSQISPMVLLSFNVFLTLLGLGSFILIPYVWKQKSLAMKLSLMAGVSYLLVYGVDLLAWFPQSPTPMSPALLWIEVIGSVIAIPLVWLSFMATCTSTEQASETRILDREVPALKIIMLTLAGLAVVIFATLSAIQSGG